MSFEKGKRAEAEANAREQTAKEAAELQASAKLIITDDPPKTEPVSDEYVDPAEAFMTDEHLTDEPPAEPLIVDPTVTASEAAMLRVAQAMEKIVTRQDEQRQVGLAEVRPVSSFNPTGDRNHPKFTRLTMMDGITLNSLMHTAEEVNLFNQIKPGRYWDRKIEVRRGSAGEIDLVRIGGKLDQRMERSAKFPTLVSMLTFIIQERERKEQRRKQGLFDDDEAV
jgi:hypothetical protein